MQRILVRATNWVGDAVMSLPALAAVRARFPAAHIAILARPWVSGLYAQEPFANEIIPYQPPKGWQGWKERRNLADQLKKYNFDAALLIQNAFDAALIAWMANIPVRIGYARDGRTALLTHAVPRPAPGTLPPHESFYYLNLVHSVGWLPQWPAGEPTIRLSGASNARDRGNARFAMEGIHQPILGVSPGAAYGTAKRWIPERFAEASHRLATQLGAHVALFGSPAEQGLCEYIRGRINLPATNYAGATSLAEYIERAAACALYLTNDSGAMHIASALGVPTVAVFGATNHVTTGPTGPLARIVREPVECSPCLLRECPIDHRCMQAVSAERVTDVALDLIQQKR